MDEEGRSEAVVFNDSYRSQVKVNCNHCGGEVLVINPPNALNFDSVCGRCEHDIHVRPPWDSHRPH